MNPGDISRLNRIRSNALIAMTDPGRYSPQERSQLTGWLGDQARRQQEMEMLRQNGINDIEKAGVEGKWKAEAARLSGAEAAKYNSDGVKEAAINQMYGERAKADAAIKAAQSQWGYVDDNGNWVSGGAERSARTQADAAIEAAREKADSDMYAAEQNVAVQREKNKGLRDQADIERAAREFEYKNKKEIAQLQVDGRLPNQSEMAMLYRLQQDEKYKDKNVAELLAIIRARGGQNT